MLPGQEDGSRTPGVSGIGSVGHAAVSSLTSAFSLLPWGPAHSFQSGSLGEEYLEVFVLLATSVCTSEIISEWKVE